jgi:hypothetical protein
MHTQHGIWLLRFLLKLDGQAFPTELLLTLSKHAAQQ